MMRKLLLGTIAAASMMPAGCRTIGGTPTGLRDIFGPPESDVRPVSFVSDPADPSGDDSADGEITAKPVEPGFLAGFKRSTVRMGNFLTGKEQENPVAAKEFYRQGDAQFRLATSQQRPEAIGTFRDAAKQFAKAGQAAPGTALQQDAMFMQAESLFFADRLTQARDVYEALQKEFPRNRHSDRVGARLFSIGRYWIDIDKANQGKWFTASFFDPKRPRLDVDGHAVKVLDQIRYDDPTGKLADDATMAAAAEHIRQGNFEEADEFLTDLRDSFPDSQHLFLAHLLGIRCKLEVYAGPEYSALLLEEADKLVQQTRQRFPDRLREQQYADLLARAANEIEYHKANKLLTRAKYRDKQHNYGAAATYYQKLLDEHSGTSFADPARDRLEEVADLPATPAKRLTWLQAMFPDRHTKSPLQPVGGGDATMMR